MRQLFFAMIVAMGAVIAAPAHAAWIFVGSWEVNEGPGWTSQPDAYTGQQAAALLFGGLASDYGISTVSNDPAQINFSAWYSVLGYSGPNNGGVMFAQDYVSSVSSQAPGKYYSGDSFPFEATDAASAYVDDNAFIGNRNYAFVQAIPLPAPVVLLGAGILGLAMVGRRKAV